MKRIAITYFVVCAIFAVFAIFLYPMISSDTYITEQDAATVTTTPQVSSTLDGMGNSSGGNLQDVGSGQRRSQVLSMGKGSLTVVVSIRDETIGRRTESARDIDPTARMFVASLRTPSGEVYETRVAHNSNSIKFYVPAEDSQAGYWTVGIDEQRNFFSNQMVVVLAVDDRHGDERVAY